MLRTIPFLIAVTVSFSSFAEENPSLPPALTTEHFSQICNNETTDFEGVVSQTSCIAYIQGAAEMYALLREIDQTPQLEYFDWANYICFPEGATTPQTAKIFVEWVKQNPEYLHEHRIWSLFTALLQNKDFNCPEEHFQPSDLTDEEMEELRQQVISNISELAAKKRGEQ